MPWMPSARKREIPENRTAPRINANKVILHSAVGPGSLYGYFSRDDIKVESHFWVGLNGEIEQYLDTDVRADANWEANDSAIAVETADNGDPDNFMWTNGQVLALIRIIKWASEVHGIPIRLCPSATSSGIGYHRQFKEWNKASHSCPGDIRVKMVPGIIAQAKDLDMPLTDADVKKIWFTDGIVTNRNAPPDSKNPTWAPKTALELADDKLDKIIATLKTLTITGLTEAQLDAIVDRVITEIQKLHLTK